MNNSQNETYTSLHDLAASLIKMGVKTGNSELLFLGTSFTTMLRAATDQAERAELSGLLMKHTVTRLKRSAGLSSSEILISDLFESNNVN